MTQLIGCGGRPISMAHFMTDKNGVYVTYQKNIRTIEDDKILSNNDDYKNSFENDGRVSIGGMINVVDSSFKLGAEFGDTGLAIELGYNNKQIGIMGWGTATFGFPCYGVQGAYSFVNNRYVNVGPVIYYARNSTINIIKERNGFTYPEGWTSYSESGVGLYSVFSITSYLKIEFDYKYGANWDEPSNKHYLTFGLQFL